MGEKARIGIIGFGYIGSYVYNRILSQPEHGLEVAFVHEKAKEKLKDSPTPLLLDDLHQFTERNADLVVEMAHPLVSREYGAEILRSADYMPLSLTALADAKLFSKMQETAEKNGTCLYIPHGAAVGLESLHECRDSWKEVRVVMKKNPKNLDFSNAPKWKPDEIKSETILYEGPTRQICSMFPRNVNAHAAVALAGIGFDKTHSVLVADPSLDVSVIEIEAKGEGVEMKIQRANKLKGVSGVFTLAATFGAILRARSKTSHLQVC
jgi:aspartate dehydrogenase